MNSSRLETRDKGLEYGVQSSIGLEVKVMEEGIIVLFDAREVIGF